MVSRALPKQKLIGFESRLGLKFYIYLTVYRVFFLDFSALSDFFSGNTIFQLRVFFGSVPTKNCLCLSERVPFLSLLFSIERFFFVSGKSLTNLDETLNSYGITNNSKVMLIMGSKVSSFFLAPLFLMIFSNTRQSFLLALKIPKGNWSLRETSFRGGKSRILVCWSWQNQRENREYTKGLSLWVSISMDVFTDINCRFLLNRTDLNHTLEKRWKIKLLQFWSTLNITIVLIAAGWKHGSNAIISTSFAVKFRSNKIIDVNIILFFTSIPS